MIWIYLYFFAVCFVCSFALTWILRRWAVALGFLDQPAERKIHSRPMPMMGGVALFFAFFGVVWTHLLVVVLMKIGFLHFPWLPHELLSHLRGVLKQMPKTALILAGGAIISGVGLYDDRFHITPKTKFLFQLGVAILIVAGGIHLKLFLHSSWLAGLISVLWLVSLMNAFNLLDNMDGLSAGVALIACAIFSGIAISTGQYFLSASLMALSGVLAGFLWFNFPPASIFMGDCGSQLIGYLMGVFTILQTYYSPRFPTHFPVLMPLLILAVPLYDTVSVIVIRMLKRESIFRADKRHFSHRLHALGMSFRGTVLFIYLVTLALGLSAPLLPFLSAAGAGVLFLQALAMLAVIAILETFGKIKLEGKSR